MWSGRYRFRLTAMIVVLAGLGAGPVRGQQQDERPELPAGSQMVRGTVMASGADGISVKTASGEIYKVTATPNTHVMKARQPVKLAEIKAGDGVGAVGVMDPSTKTLHAMFMTVMDAEQVKRAQADLGKTYIAGEVTAIAELKLTIKRADGVVQTIAVDEGTSFRRGGRGMGMGAGAGEGSANGGDGAGAQRAPRPGDGGESITLADLKVGDAVIGRGALKGGVFVPTELRVMDPAARGRRRSGASGPEGGAAPSQPPPQDAPR